MRTSPLCARVLSIPPLPQLGSDTRLQNHVHSFLLGVCPHTPHRTISAASGRKPKIRTLSFYLGRGPGATDRGHCVESSLSPRGLCSDGLSRLRSAADLPPDPRLLPSVAWLPGRPDALYIGICHEKERGSIALFLRVCTHIN